MCKKKIEKTLKDLDEKLSSFSTVEERVAYLTSLGFDVKPLNQDEHKENLMQNDEVQNV